MPEVNIGGNRFENVAIPLVLDDRYFLVEHDDGQDIWTVFTIVNGRPVLEILRNQPQENEISTVEANPTGIITVSDSQTGQFRYKVRPGAKGSSIFGTIDGRETEIQVFDREVRVGTNVFRNNRVMGFPVGIRIAGSSIGLGGGFPPEFRQLVGE